MITQSPTKKIILRIMDNIAEIIYPGAGEFTLGRVKQEKTDSGSQEHQFKRVDTDLTGFQAYESGGSRRHAPITIENNRAYLMDLGSTNGTCLSGSQLAGFQPFELNNGDLFTLGSLKVNAMIHPSGGLTNDGGNR